MSENEIVVGLDVGTTKVCAIVAERTDEGQIRIIGMAKGPSEGLRKGCVINIESTIESIGKVIDEAESMAGIEINSVFAGIAGGHIKSINSRGVTPVNPEGSEIDEEDINRAINAAKAISIPLDREIIHSIPQEFIVDGQSGIKDPRGMVGVRLEAQVHLVSGAITSAQNLIKCIHRTGLEVEDIVLEPLASAIAILTEEEKQSGVILIDIGGGTTDFLLFVNGSIRHSDILAIGGDHVTNDIAIGMKIPSIKAEEIKKKFGCALSDMVKKDEEFVLPGIVGRSAQSLPRIELCNIIELRMEEILTLVKSEIEHTGNCHLVGSGIVLTGGASLLSGTIEMAQKIFNIPVKLGKPRNISGLVEVLDSPIYSTGVGLTQYGFRYRDEGGVKRLGGRNLFAKIMKRMREWFWEYF
ncbi:MAG: cell division protein FtsA [Candidatus Theseobacter exili]|nr:cell division protein FtsA [Candidatus Theseobacter exili]